MSYTTSASSRGRSRDASLPISDARAAAVAEQVCTVWLNLNVSAQVGVLFPSEASRSTRLARFFMALRMPLI